MSLPAGSNSPSHRNMARGSTSLRAFFQLKVANLPGSLRRVRGRFVFARTGSLVTAATRARLPHTVRIFAGARTAKARPGVRVSGLSGPCAFVSLRRGVRRAGNENNCRQCNGSQHADFRSHENSSHKGRIMANGNVYAVADPRCVPGFARAEIISALLFAATATPILAKCLAKKQKLPWGNRRMANDDTWERNRRCPRAAVRDGIRRHVADLDVCKPAHQAIWQRSTATKIVITRSSQGGEESRPPFRPNADACRCAYVRLADKRCA
jgi:hypothetical protein